MSRPVSLTALLFLVGLAVPAAGQQVFLDPVFGVSVTNDVHYGNGDVGYGSPGGVESMDLHLDLYQPVGPGLPSLLPAVIMVPGGGFTNRNRPLAAGFMSFFAAHGYVSAAIDCRVLDDLIPPEIATLGSGFDPEIVLQGQSLATERANVFAAQINDMITAITWMQANAASLGVDPNRLVVMGGSSGARVALAVGLAEASDDVAAIVSLLGGISGNESFVDVNDPAVVLAAGLYDTTVPPDSSILIADIADSIGLPYQLFLGEAGHDAGFFIQDGPGGPPYVQTFNFLFDELNLASIPGGGSVLPEPSSVALLAVASLAAAGGWSVRRLRRGRGNA